MRAGGVLLIVAVWTSVVIPHGRAADEVRITTAARSVRPGELVILTAVISGQAAGADAAEIVRVHAFGRDIPAFSEEPHAWRALVGIDLEVRPGRYPASVEVRAGSEMRQVTTALVVTPRMFPTRRLSVDPAFVNPPPEAEGRIVQDAKDLDALWAASSSSRLWNGPFRPPVPGSASGRFGARSLFNGQPRSRHSGEDFQSAEGTPVMAPNAGRIVLARDLYFAGNTVVIDHGLGLFSLLEHLSAIDVKERDRVEMGQRVGLVGATGRVTGPHLHWAVRVNGARVDPLSLLASLGGSSPTVMPR